MFQDCWPESMFNPMSKSLPSSAGVEKMEKEVMGEVDRVQELAGSSVPACTIPIPNTDQLEIDLQFCRSVVLAEFSSGQGDERLLILGSLTATKSPCGLQQ